MATISVVCVRKGPLDVQCEKINRRNECVINRDTRTYQLK